MFLSQQQREQHEREALHHALVSSEELYVSELECLVLRLAVPLQSAAQRMSLSAASISTVFGLLQHLHSFHHAWTGSQTDLPAPFCSNDKRYHPCQCLGGHAFSVECVSFALPRPCCLC